MMPRGLTHVLGSLVAIVSGLGGFALLASGGTRLYRAYLSLDLGSGMAASGVGIQIAGIALLVVAALTGLWTPAGLLCLGAFGIVALVASAFPLALFAVVREMPSLATAPINLVTSGVPHVLGGILGACGLAVVLLQRRRTTLQAHVPAPAHASNPSGAVAGHIIGVIAAPILFVLGLGLLLRGMFGTMQSAQVQMVQGSEALWLLMSLGGFVLILAACVTVRWSPFALVLPAIIVLLLTALSFAPQWGFAYSLDVIARSVGTFLVLGGFAAAAMLIAGTVVAISHWSRNRRIMHNAVHGSRPMPDGPLAPGAAPAHGTPPPRSW